MKLNGSERKLSTTNGIQVIIMLPKIEYFSLNCRSTSCFWHQSSKEKSSNTLREITQ